MSPATSSTLTHLECSLCSKKFAPGKIYNLCDCGGPLLVRYDLEKLRHTWTRDHVRSGPNSMWRYGPVLPPSRQPFIISLGEGMTPLVATARLGTRLGAGAITALERLPISQRPRHGRPTKMRYKPRGG